MLESSSNKLLNLFYCCFCCCWSRVWCCFSIFGSNNNNSIVLLHAQFASVTDGRKINHHSWNVFYVTAVTWLLLCIACVPSFWFFSLLLLLLLSFSIKQLCRVRGMKYVTKTFISFTSSFVTNSHIQRYTGSFAHSRSLFCRSSFFTLAYIHIYYICQCANK